MRSGKSACTAGYSVPASLHAEPVLLVLTVGWHTNEIQVIIVLYFVPPAGSWSNGCCPSL